MSNSSDDHQFEMLINAFKCCQKGSKILTKINSHIQLKHTHIWTELETILKMMQVDSCWFYQYLTGIECDCNPETEKRAKQWLEIIQFNLKEREEKNEKD